MLKKINPLNHRAFIFIAWLTALTISCFIPLLSLTGSYRFILSGINVVLPLAGGLFSCSMAGMLIASLWILKLLLWKLPITVGLPSACSVLSWAGAANSQKQKALNIVINALLPALCMAIFILHPIAGFAWPYALYWLIPIVIYFLDTKNTLVIALQSTFIAHAVGSTMWLFLVPMTAAAWLALIPVVALERLSIALVATILFKAIKKASVLVALRLNKRKNASS